MGALGLSLQAAATTTTLAEPVHDLGCQRRVISTYTVLSSTLNLPNSSFFSVQLSNLRPTALSFHRVPAFLAYFATHTVRLTPTAPPFIYWTATHLCNNERSLHALPPHWNHCYHSTDPPRLSAAAKLRVPNRSMRT